MRHMRGSFLLLVSLFLLPMCGESLEGQGAPGIFFPTWTRTGDPEPTGAVLGRLIERDGCLFIDEEPPGSARFLPLWPDSFGLRAGASPSIEGNDGIIVQVGESILVGGGSWEPLPAAQALIGREIPDRCKAAPWLVTEVVPE